MHKEGSKKSKTRTALFGIFIVLILFHHIAFNAVALSKVSSINSNDDILDTDLVITNLEISNNINPNTLKITWDSVKGANFYVVYYRDKVNKKWMKNIIPWSNYTVIDGLLANTKYEVIAKACNNDYYCNQLTPSEYITTQKIKDKIVCNENFVIEENGILSVRIAWGNNVKAREYIIKMQKVSEPNISKQIYKGENKVVTINDLEPNMEYKFSIDACYENKKCIKLHKPQKIVMAFKPYTPKKFAIDVEDLGIIKLAWENQTFASYYNISIGSDTEKNIYSIKTSDNHYTFKNMANHTEYFFWLQSCNKRNECSELTDFQSVKAINTQQTNIAVNRVNEKFLDDSIELFPLKEKTLYTKLISNSFIEKHQRNKISDVSNYVDKHSFQENKQGKENYTVNKTKYPVTNYKSYQYNWANIKACLNTKNCSQFYENSTINTLYDTQQVDLYSTSTRHIVKGFKEEVKVQSITTNLSIDKPQYIEANNIKNKIDSYVLWKKVNNAQFYNIYLLNTANNKSKHIKLNKNNIQNIKFREDKNQYNYYYIDAKQSAKLKIQQEQEYNVWVQACITEDFCSELSDIASLKTEKIKSIESISKVDFLKKEDNKVLFSWFKVRNKNIIYNVYQTTDKRLDGKLVYSGRRPSLDISNILVNKPNYFYVLACKNEICSSKSEIIYLNKENYFFDSIVLNFLKQSNKLVIETSSAEF